MSNSFAPLVRMLELRIARQKQSLEESQKQLEAAIISRNLEERDRNGAQRDLVKEFGTSGKK